MNENVLLWPYGLASWLAGWVGWLGGMGGLSRLFVCRLIQATIPGKGYHHAPAFIICYGKYIHSYSPQST